MLQNEEKKKREYNENTSVKKERKPKGRRNTSITARLSDFEDRLHSWSGCISTCEWLTHCKYVEK